MKTHYKIAAFIFAFFHFSYINAQISFEQVLPQPPAPQQIADFDAVQNSSIAFADVDGDNDQDVLITGQNYFNQLISKLYTNDSNGNFSLVSGTPFEGVEFGSTAFADVDGDNDQDVLITGQNSSGIAVANFYINDGSGSFSLVSGTSFEGVEYSSISFADVDGDNDQDVLITGKKNSTGLPISNLYINDGSGNFSLISGTPFDGVYYSSISFADVDGDNDQDVLITGKNSSNQCISKLYTNDGNGNYALVSGTPFDGVWYSSIAFADVDGDNDQDVLITGKNSSNQYITNLYTNSSSGTFSLVSGTPFDGVTGGSIAFADVDSDNDQDVLITGGASAQSIAKLYTNDGNGNYTLVSNTPFNGVVAGSIAFADVDGDNNQDMLITGKNNSNLPITILYINDGSGNFTLVSGTPFDGVWYSSIAFADVDGDNNQDMLITGKNSSNLPIAELYTNDGNGNYTLVSSTPFDGVWYSSIAFADVDGDNDQDVLITGESNTQSIAKLYTNDGNGNFSMVSGTPFDGVTGGSIAFADVDGDNDQDVLITGLNIFNQRIAKLYTNDGNGNYTLVSGTPFDGVNYSSIAFADVDGDSDQDVLITGENNTSLLVTNLFTNDGNGNFSMVSGTPFNGVQSGSLAFADVDGDNDQDVLITGSGNAKLFTNDGNGNFTLVFTTPFEGVSSSSIAFTDVDGDNDPDVLITGRNNSSIQFIAKLYINYGNGNFTLISGTPFDGVEIGSIAFSDIDGDNDQDVLISGRNNSGQEIAKLYRNTTPLLNINSNNFPKESIVLYPNPTQNEFTISLGNIKSSTVEVIDLNGKIIMNIPTQSNTVNVDMNNLGAGVYFVKVVSEKGNYVEKVVKQ